MRRLYFIKPFFGAITVGRFSCLPRVWCVRFFLLLLLLFVSGVAEVVGQVPNYTHDASNSRNLDRFTLTLADAVNLEAKLNRIILSVDTNPEGERFVLTYGNGIKKVGDNDGLIDFIPNQNGRLSNPLDFAINSEGKFFVATNESNRRFIRVYSPEGVYLPNEELGNGSYGNSGADRFKGPTGLTFDNDDNLFVADHYIGDNVPSRPSSIKIYRKDASGSYKNNLINEFDNVQGTLLNFPYRLAVNSEGHLYMAELGQNNSASVKVLQLDNNFNPTQIDEISGNEIGSPGSIIIDKFDNIFIADFGEDLDLSRVLEATNDVDEFYEVFEIIKRGIANNLFNINVYNPNNSFRLQISSQIDFPVDLAISDCGSLYVNNAIFDGEIDTICLTPWGPCYDVPDFTLDFDLEAYQRSPGYDTEAPRLVFCPEDQQGELSNGIFALPDYRDLTQFEDNCDDDLEIVQNPPANTPITESTEVTVTAIDDAGNEDSCTFMVTIEEVPPSFTCPEEDEIPGLTLNAGCDYEETDFTAYLSDFANFENDPFFEESVSRDDYILTVEITVYDGEGGDLVNSCSFEVALNDVTDPLVSECPVPDPVSLAPGESYNLPNFIPNVSATDNCDDNLEIVQDPPANTPITQTTEVTITATDDAGNVDSCTFKVTIEEVPPSFTCPEQDEIPGLALDADCNYEETDFTAYLSDFTNFENEPFFEESVIRDDYILTVEITVYDGEGGDLVNSCSFEVALNDVTDPLVSDCPTPDPVILALGESYNLPNFIPNISATDNCDDDLQIVQDPPANTPITETTEITITATDDAGNRDSCTFMVTIEEVPPSFICPEEDEIPGLTLDPDCNYEETDFTAYLSDFTNFENEPFFEESVSRDDYMLTVEIIVYDGEGGALVNSCSFEVALNDVTDPLISGCPTPDPVISTPGESYNLPNFIPNISATDNCDDDLEIVQDPPANSPITESTEVTITVTDDAGNVDSCTFLLTIEEEEETPPETSCIDRTVYLDENGQVQITAEEIYGSDPDLDNISLSLSETNFGCADAGKTIPVTLRVTDTQTTLFSECTTEITVIDSIAPQRINCSESRRIFTVAYGETGRNVIYEVPEFADNCDEELTIDIDGPASGEFFPLGDTVVTYTATDEFDNSSSCSFIIEVQANADEIPPLFIDCAQSDITATTAAGQCEATIDFPVPEATDNSGNVTVELTSELGPGDNFPIGETDVTFTATDAEGHSVTCSFTITVIDNEEPIISCPGPKTEVFDPEAGFTVPDYRDEFALSDNCTPEEQLRNSLVQTPAAGTVIYESQTISFTTFDNSGNPATCSFELTLEEEDTDIPLEISGCPGPQRGSLDSYCTFTIPDYTGEVSTNIPANITQVPTPGSSIYQDTRVSVIATTSLGEVDVCYVEITLDTSLPDALNCPPEVEEADYDSDQGYFIGSYLSRYHLDFCERNFTVVQTPEFGTPITEDTPVHISVSDAAGNVVSCDFLVTVPGDTSGPPVANDDFYETYQDESLIISAPGVLGNDSSKEEALTATIRDLPGNGTISLNPDGSFTYEPDEGFSGSDTFTYVANDATADSNIATVTIEVIPVTPANDPPIALDDHYSTPENVTLTITAPGVLANDTDPESDDLTARLINYVPVGDLTLNSDGSFTYVPETDYEGSVTFTYVANDGTADSDIATVTIEVTAASVPANCRPFTVFLDSDGVAILNPDDIFEGDPNEPEIERLEVDQENFDCSDLGTNTVTLTVHYRNGSSTSCNSVVTVEDNLPPTASCVSEFTLYLNREGFGILSGSIIDNGSTDNCQIEEMLLSKTHFYAEDLGQQEVTLTVRDAAGNIDTCTATVIVEPFDEDREVSCAGSITLPLDENGEANLDLRYSGNEENEEVEVSKSYFTCDDIGTETVIATYWGEFAGSCEIEINIVDNLPPQVSCISAYDLQLEEDGTAVLSVDDVHLSSSDNCGIETISLSKTTFTTADIGSQQVTLSVIDFSGNSGICTVTVNVEPQEGYEAPVVCVDTFTLELGPDGTASLGPEELYTGGTTGMQVGVDKTAFTCADLGEQVVTFSYDTGNDQGSCEITIYVTDPNDHCTIDPVEPSPPVEEDFYLTIYPNPGSGLVYVSTNGDLDLTRAEVFDMRGRFLFSKEFAESDNDRDKVIDLREYQSGVYVIIYYTENRKFIRRAIINRD